jgi:uncharacterized protein (TIGR03083 family)
MTSERERIISVLLEEWATIDDLLESLRPEEWSTPTDLPGWDVRDNVAHLIGIEATLLGDPAPAASPELAGRAHVHNDLGAMNEAWVESFRQVAPEQVLARFRDVTSRRADALRAMTDEQFLAPTWTPVGEADYARFMQIRNFDCWFHEQDIREALGRPGNLDSAPADEALAEVTRMLGYVVAKRAGAPQGSAVTFRLDGPIRREVHVVVEGRAQVVAVLDREPDVTIRLGSDLFMRLAGGRVSATAVRDRVDVQGDVELATEILDHLGYVI